MWSGNEALVLTDTFLYTCSATCFIIFNRLSSLVIRSMTCTMVCRSWAFAFIQNLLEIASLLSSKLMLAEKLKIFPDEISSQISGYVNFSYVMREFLNSLSNAFRLSLKGKSVMDALETNSLVSVISKS